MNNDNEPIKKLSAHLIGEFMIFGIKRTYDTPPIVLNSNEWIIRFDKYDENYILIINDFEFIINEISVQALYMFKDCEDLIKMIEIDVEKGDLIIWN